jgi:hypothetical protein
MKKSTVKVKKNFHGTLLYLAAQNLNQAKAKLHSWTTILMRNLTMVSTRAPTIPEDQKLIQISSILRSNF